MFVWILFIIIGFLLLIKGADILVDSASNIAKRFHIPEIIIGLTVVSIGTSMPELFVSISSAVDGYPDMAIGNVIGSSIANLLLILGVSTIISTLPLKKETRLIEIPLCLVITLVFFALSNLNQDISRIDASILIVLFILFIMYTIIMAFKGEKFDKEENEEEKIEDTKKTSIVKDVIFLFLGVLMLKFGGDLTVNNAVKVANVLKWSEKLISITILAIGTSLPELVTSVTAGIKGENDIAIGNILGSNIFNMLLIIGVSGLIKPITYNLNYNTDMYVLLGATLILSLFPVIPPKNKMSRSNRNNILFTLFRLYYLFFYKIGGEYDYIRKIQNN